MSVSQVWLSGKSSHLEVLGGGRQMNMAVTSVTEWEMLGEWERSRCRRTVWGVGRLFAVVGHGDFSASAGGMES